MATEEKTLPRLKDRPSVPAHVGFVENHYFITKKELLEWIDAHEARYQNKATASGDANIVRVSMRTAEATSKLRYQINPLKEDQMFDKPVDVMARLAAIIKELEELQNKQSDSASEPVATDAFEE